MPPQTAPAGFPELAQGGVATVQDQWWLARNAKPVDPIRTTHKCQLVLSCGVLIRRPDPRRALWPAVM